MIKINTFWNYLYYYYLLNCKIFKFTSIMLCISQTSWYDTHNFSVLSKLLTKYTYLIINISNITKLYQWNIYILINKIMSYDTGIG